MLPMFVSFPKGFFTTLFILSGIGIFACFALVVFTIFKAVTVGGLWLFFAGVCVATIILLLVIDGRTQ